MNKGYKKITAILITITFLLTLASTSSAFSIKKENLNFEEKTQTEEEFLEETVTIFRHGLDGSINPIEVDIRYKEGQDVSEAINEKCDELLLEDNEIQDFLGNVSNISIGAFCKIQSKGKGFHYQMKLLGKIAIRYILFRLGLPRIHTILNKPVILCKYKNDPKANTTITSMILKGRKQFTEGDHIVFVHSFVGYTSWFGRFSFTPFNLFPRSFTGYAKFATCIQLN